jgi:hypothetical protein
MQYVDSLGIDTTARNRGDVDGKSRDGTQQLLHHPTVIGIHNSEFRGQKAVSMHANYKWSHHYCRGQRAGLRAETRYKIVPAP